MALGKKISKLGKRYVILSTREIAFEKRLHKRHLRRIRKDINKPNPQNNRYSGWLD